MKKLVLFDRLNSIFQEEISEKSNLISQKVNSSSFLIVGAAGTIGKAVTFEILARKPKKIHLVDISENNLVELVRDFRSSLGYINGEFQTFTLDFGSLEFDAFFHNCGPYDYILNLSAIKHVRSEKDPYTLMRMINVNILNTLNLVNLSKNTNIKNFFSVSTDKATNPVNFMGATKLIMEKVLINSSKNQKVSMARFANVTFSDGSLLHGFEMRMKKKQPIAVPKNIKRYFMTQQEAGQLCLLSCLFGKNREIFFPKVNNKLKLISFYEILTKYLNFYGYEPYECLTELESREKSKELIKKKKWPCYLFESDTSGEKYFELFYNENEQVNFRKYTNIGIIKKEFCEDDAFKIKVFLKKVNNFKEKKIYSKNKFLEIFNEILANFNYLDKEKNLEQKM